MKKATLILVLLVVGVLLFSIFSTLRCKSLAKNSASRVGYSFRDGCYINLSGERVPLQ